MNLTERKIIFRLVKDALASGFLVSVHDGEEIALARSDSLIQILNAMASTDEDSLHFYRRVETDGFPSVGGFEFLGWVRLIYGNDTDVISDNTDNDAMNDLLHGAERLAEQIANEPRVTR